MLENVPGRYYRPTYGDVQRAAAAVTEVALNRPSDTDTAPILEQDEHAIGGMTAPDTRGRRPPAEPQPGRAETPAPDAPLPSPDRPAVPDDAVCEPPAKVERREHATEPDAPPEPAAGGSGIDKSPPKPPRPVPGPPAEEGPDSGNSGEGDQPAVEMVVAGSRTIALNRTYYDQDVVDEAGALLTEGSIPDSWEDITAVVSPDVDGVDDGSMDAERRRYFVINDAIAPTYFAKVGDAAAHGEDTVFDEMHMVPEIRGLVEADEAQAIVAAHGFASIQLIEPLAAAHNTDEHTRTVVYPYQEGYEVSMLTIELQRVPPPGMEKLQMSIASLQALENNLSDYFRRKKIDPVDFSYVHLMAVGTETGAVHLYMFDIEHMRRAGSQPAAQRQAYPQKNIIPHPLTGEPVPADAVLDDAQWIARSRELIRQAEHPLPVAVPIPAQELAGHAGSVLGALERKVSLWDAPTAFMTEEGTVIRKYENSMYISGRFVTFTVTLEYRDDQSTEPFTGTYDGFLPDTGGSRVFFFRVESGAAPQRDQPSIYYIDHPFHQEDLGRAQRNTQYSLQRAWQLLGITPDA